MARNVALTRSAQPPSNKKRSRARKRNARGAPARPSLAEWSDLEQAFFASAPPDEPEATVEPECFDDLVATAPPRRERFGALRRLVAAAGSALRRLFLGAAERSRRASPL
jgi:hypothetical protein